MTTTTSKLRFAHYHHKGDDCSGFGQHGHPCVSELCTGPVPAYRRLSTPFSGPGLTLALLISVMRRSLTARLKLVVNFLALDLFDAYRRALTTPPGTITLPRVFKL